MGTIRPNGLYCAYLRKSRRDVELEALGQGETLARHEKQLAELADRLGIRVARWYREIVSGDTIAERPQVRQLLEDVGAGLWDGVLVMDVDRLGRGDSIDQGVIMQTFMYSGTLIVTPDKTYDPADDSDSEFFEIKLFFSRREYAMIKKRMQRGRLASVMDGCYLGPKIYGYRRVKLEGRKGWSLEIDPDQAPVVRSVFDWYANGLDGEEVGAAKIALRLNALGLRTNAGVPFEAGYIRQMLQNPTYAGKVRWNQRTTQRAIKDGRRVTRRPICDAPIIVDGLHPAIVDPALFDRVQAMFSDHAKRPRNVDAPVVNSLGGLVICAQCGRTMQLKQDRRRPDGFLYCPRQGCPTASTYIGVVESVVMDGLREWLSRYQVSPVPVSPDPRPSDDAARAARAKLEAQLSTLEGQSSRLFDLLEQGLYTPEVYRQRRADLDARIADTRAALDALTLPPPADPVAPLIPRIRTVVDAYAAATTPAQKYALFHSVLDHITYNKTRRCYRNNAPTDNLTLTLFPKLPDDPGDLLSE